MRPTWLLSGQTAGSEVRRPVLFGTTLFGVLEMLARYFLVAEAVKEITLLIFIKVFKSGNNCNLLGNKNNRQRCSPLT